MVAWLRSVKIDQDVTYDYVDMDTIIILYRNTICANCFAWDDYKSLSVISRVFTALGRTLFATKAGCVPIFFFFR